VIGLGELLWDVFPDSRRPGGAPANVAFQSQQLGCRGLVASCVGEDEPGGELRVNLVERGLDTSLVQRDADHPTGRVTVDVSDPHHPRYTIHEDVAWDFLQPDENLMSAAREASAICFGTLAQRSPVSRETIHAVLDAAGSDCLIVFDVNLRQQWYDRERIERSLRQADIVKLNHEEAAVLSEMFGFGVQEHRTIAAALQDRFNVDLVCITRAEKGCLLVNRDGIADVPGRKVEVVDAVGAGDAFTAALIVTQLEGWPLQSAAEFANHVGGLVATRRGASGAMPEQRDEYKLLRKTYDLRNNPLTLDP
jgi:fructokinase